MRENLPHELLRKHEVSVHFLLFSCVNVLREGRPKSHSNHTEIRVLCVVPGSGGPPVFLNGIRLDLSEADRKAAGPKHDRSMRLGQRDQGPGALHKDYIKTSMRRYKYGGPRAALCFPIRYYIRIAFRETERDDIGYENMAQPKITQQALPVQRSTHSLLWVVPCAT